MNKTSDNTAVDRIEREVTGMAAQPTPMLGAWARADGFIGVIARTGDGQVTLFDPGQRRQHVVPAEAIELVPSAAVRVTVTVDLPLPHGVDETVVRRWVAMLTDPLLRDRAADALSSEHLDTGVTLPPVAVSAVAISDGLMHCLCGATTNVPDSPAAPTACPRCGRQPAPPAASPPA